MSIECVVREIAVRWMLVNVGRFFKLDANKINWKQSFIFPVICEIIRFASGVNAGRVKQMWKWFEQEITKLEDAICPRTGP